MQLVLSPHEAVEDECLQRDFVVPKRKGMGETGIRRSFLEAVHSYVGGAGPGWAGGGPGSEGGEQNEAVREPEVLVGVMCVGPSCVQAGPLVPWGALAWGSGLACKRKSRSGRRGGIVGTGWGGLRKELLR